MDFKKPNAHFSLARRVGGSAILLALLVTSFQNCGKAGFDSEMGQSVLDSASSSANQNLLTKYGQLYGPKVQAIPFAFDVEVDQITYNSCNGSSYQKKPGAFTFKVGAYKATSGLKLRQTYHDYITNNFKPVYPNTVVTEAEKKAYLYDSPNNQGVTLQFAWRNYAQPYWVRNSSSPKATVDYVDYGLAATDDRILTPLFKSSVASFFGLAPEVQQRTLEYSIFYNQSEAWADWFRRDMTSAGNDGQRGILALTFKKPSGEAFEPAAPTANDPKVAYGRGFTFIFGKHGSAPALNNPENVLTGVSEVNLETSAKAPVTGSWSCPSTLRLLIVRPKDAATACPAPSFASLSNSTIRDRLKILRRHLPASQWDVNPELNCAVPKNFDCYSTDQYNGGLVPVEYNPANECFENIPDKVYTSGTPPVPVCAQYISVCVK